MAVAAVGDEALGLGDGVVEVGRLIHAEYGAELLVRHLLGEPHGLDLADEDLGGFGNLDAGDLGDAPGGLADDLGVDGAVDDDRLADAVEFLALEEVAAATLELGLGLGVGLIAHHGHALL